VSFAVSTVPTTAQREESAGLRSMLLIVLLASMISIFHEFIQLVLEKSISR
jgi:hypothetical protein